MEASPPGQDLSPLDPLAAHGLPVARHQLQDPALRLCTIGTSGRTTGTTQC